MKEGKQNRPQTCPPSNKKSRKNEPTKTHNDSKAPFTIPNDSSLSLEVKKSVCRYLIENGHAFTAVTSPSFKKMICLCLGKVDLQMPTVKDLKGSIFNDVVKEMEAYVSAIKNSWPEDGCSILLDEWTSSKGRNLMNVLLDCPKGAIYVRSYDISDIRSDPNAFRHFFEELLTEIGIGNVVQVVTNSSSFLKHDFRTQLSEKLRSVFLTRCASCCIGLMLEKISAIDHIKEALSMEKAITEFIYTRPSALEHLRDRIDGYSPAMTKHRIKPSIPFRRLESILEERVFLAKTLLSRDFADGRSVVKILEDKSFWSGVQVAVRAAMPLVRVIDWMDKNDKAQISYIYETIDQAKETIKEEFDNKESDYMPYWEIIDQVWSELFHSPLHSACYFFNPNLFYLSDFVIDPEVVSGLFRCIIRSTDDVRVLDKISLQLELYQSGKGCFAEGRDTDPCVVSPVEWWYKYGKDCPELQRLALRILGQTCDGASKFQLERSLAETIVEEKGRSPSEQKELSEMAYLRYNMMLQNYASGEKYLEQGTWGRNRSTAQCDPASRSPVCQRRHTDTPSLLASMKQFEDETQAARYNKLKDMNFIPTDQIDHETLTKHHIDQQVQTYLSRSGWLDFFHIYESAYKELSLEFLSTFSYDEYRRDGIKFRAFNVERTFDVDDICRALGLRVPYSKPDEPRAGEHYKEYLQDPTNRNTCWAELVRPGEPEYNVKTSKASSLRSPGLRYIQRLLSTSLTPRGDSHGAIGLRDLFYLSRMHRGHQVHLGMAMAFAFSTQADVRSRGKIAVGPFITKVIKGLRIWPENAPEMEVVGGRNPLNEEMLLKMKMLIKAPTWSRNNKVYDWHEMYRRQTDRGADFPEPLAIEGPGPFPVDTDTAGPSQSSGDDEGESYGVAPYASVRSSTPYARR